MTEKLSEQEVHGHLFELLFLVKDRMNAVIKGADEGLSPLQVQVLRTLVKSGPMTQYALGEALHKDKSQITRLVADLVSEQLVVKEVNEADGRSFILTPGRGVAETVEGFLEAEREIVAKMLSGSTPSDIEVFSRVVVLMKHNLEQG